MHAVCNVHVLVASLILQTESAKTFFLSIWKCCFHKAFIRFPIQIHKFQFVVCWTMASGIAMQLNQPKLTKTAKFPLNYLVAISFSFANGMGKTRVEVNASNIFSFRYFVRAVLFHAPYISVYLFIIIVIIIITTYYYYFHIAFHSVFPHISIIVCIVRASEHCASCMWRWCEVGKRNKGMRAAPNGANIVLEFVAGKSG